MSTIETPPSSLRNDPATVDTAMEIDTISEPVEIAAPSGWYPPVKATFEYCLALLILIVATPITLLSALIIKLTSRGPVFYTQERQGRFGRTYRIIKLRTMVQNAEAGTGAVWSQKNDPRITRIGKFLRATHIDEFPQLINVLKGEMALIGPRPERPEIAASLEWHVPEYSQRLLVRPGITGLAQLRLPPDSEIDGVRDKVTHDLYYISNLSPWLDCRIYIKTAWLLFKTSVKAVLGFARLPDSDRVRDYVGAELKTDHQSPQKPEFVEPKQAVSSRSA